MKLTYELLHELLFYDEEDGQLYWKPRQRHHHKHVGRVTDFNNRYAGTQASQFFHPELHRKCGRPAYMIIKIFGVGHGAHRIIWWMKTGEDPGENEVDHIDHNGINNLWVNLRLVSGAINQRNLTLREDSRTGYPGVFPHTRGRYRVFVSINKKRKHLAIVDTVEEGIRIRKEFELANGYHLNHGKKKNALSNLRDP